MIETRPPGHPRKTGSAGDETNVTDIELMPDGRIFVFGTSLEVLDVLQRLRTAPGDELEVRLEQGRRPIATTENRREVEGES